MARTLSIDGAYLGMYSRFFTNHSTSIPPTISKDEMSDMRFNKCVVAR
jgi:hypothetical protein